MILLDTDHCSVLFDARHRLHAMLVNRLSEAIEGIALPVVAIEEQLRGFLAYIHREKDFQKKVWPYQRLAGFLRGLAKVDILDFTDDAARLTQSLRKQRVKAGTQDLKIAAMALSTESLLLTANLRDFQHLEGLRVENWLVDE